MSVLVKVGVIDGGNHRVMNVALLTHYFSERTEEMPTICFVGT